MKTSMQARKASECFQTAVMSRKRTPGLGKSGMSRTRERMRAAAWAWGRCPRMLMPGGCNKTAPGRGAATACGGSLVLFEEREDLGPEVDRLGENILVPREADDADVFALDDHEGDGFDGQASARPRQFTLAGRASQTKPHGHAGHGDERNAFRLDGRAHHGTGVRDALELFE